MGFVQKLATRNPRVLNKKTVVEPHIRRVPKLTLKHVLNLKNWKWYHKLTKKK